MNAIIQLTWDAPPEPVDYYIVRINGSESTTGGTSFQFVTAESSYVTAEVAAVNSAGTSNPATLGFSVPPYVPPPTMPPPPPPPPPSSPTNLNWSVVSWS